MFKKLSLVAIISCLFILGFFARPLPVRAQDETPTTTPTVTPTPIPCFAGDHYFAAGLLNGAKDAYATALVQPGEEACASAGLAKIGEKMCAVAQSQVNAGDYETAKTTYNTILTDFPASTCASDGLKDISPAACAQAASYLEKGSVQLAEDTYKKILETRPGQVCALDGLEQVAGKKCDLAAKQAASGLADKASATYEELLKTYPGLDCAVNGQAALATTPDKIRSLLQMGDYDTAWTDLQAALKNSPGDPQYRALASQPWAKAFRIKTFVGSFSGLLSLALIALALVLGYSALTSRRPKLDIDQFDVSAVDPEGTGPLKNEIQVRFEQALGNLGQLRSFKNPDLIDSALTEMTLPDIGLPETYKKFFDALIKLIPNNVVTINGSLLVDETRGAGIIVRLTQNSNKKLWGVDVVWQSDVDPAFTPGLAQTPPDHQPYKALVRYAAILAHWIYYQRTNRHMLPEAYGTDNFRSHILTYAATELQEKGTAAKPVEIMLRQALAEDLDNYVAMLNLARFTLRSNPAESEAYLLRVQDLTESLVGLKRLPHVYATYRLGANQLELFALDPLRNAQSLPAALQLLQQAVFHAQKIQENNREVTREVVGMIRIPYADALRRSGQNEQAEEIIAEVRKDSLAAPRVLYNLACYYTSQLTLPDGTPQPDAGGLDMALDFLERALLANRAYFIGAEKDPSLARLRFGLKKQAYIDRIRRKFAPLDPLELNRHCRDFCQIATRPGATPDLLDAALDYLELALQLNPAGFAAADKDPSLETLRKHPQYQSRIKDRFGQVQPPTS